MLLAYYVHDLNPFLVHFGGNWGIRWYGLAYVTAFILGYFVFKWMARNGYSEICEADVGDFITGVAIFGVLLGGRLGYMLFYDLHGFLTNPLVFFRVMDGGMSSHGGIIGVTLYTWIYARTKKIPWLNIGDNIGVVAPIGLFLGRCANFINGELYGRIATVPWAIQFPKELYGDPPETVQLAIDKATAINPQWVTVDAVVENARTSPALREQLAGILSPRYPSQLIEAGLEGLLLFAILWVLRTRCRLPNGVIAGAFFLCYAAVRIFGEMFREPDVGIPLTGFLTRGQFLSLFMFLVAVAFFIGAFRIRQFAPRWRKG